ncbi:MAG: hypothetical protein WDN72_11125 [Alphaproteobacteria bacterium]
MLNQHIFDRFYHAEKRLGATVSPLYLEKIAQRFAQGDEALYEKLKEALGESPRLRPLGFARQYLQGMDNYREEFEGAHGRPPLPIAETVAREESAAEKWRSGQKPGASIKKARRAYGAALGDALNRMALSGYELGLDLKKNYDIDTFGDFTSITSCMARPGRGRHSTKPFARPLGHGTGAIRTGRSISRL